MPELKYRPPSYRLHKASRRAIVTIHGHDHYLGEYGSPESHEKYQQLVAQWATAKQGSKPRTTPPHIDRADLRICELLVVYLEFEHVRLLGLRSRSSRTATSRG